MIVQNTRISHSVFRIAIVVNYDVFAADKEALLAVFLEIFPELTTFDIFLGVWGFDVKIFRDASSKIDHCLIKAATMKLLVASMEFSISFLHQSDPELTLVLVMSIERSLGLRVIWDSRVYNDMLPFTIFEKVEYSKTILDTIIVDQVLEKIWICAENQE
jgi:hypothetical protein